MIFINVFEVRHRYQEIMQAESELTVNNWKHILDSFEEMLGVAHQIKEFAKASSVRRSYITIYNMADEHYIFESDAAHTNLVCAILDRAINFIYGSDFFYTSGDCGYSYREIMEAARRHDLPENDTGDIPDNGSRNAEEKAKQESLYHLNFSQYSPAREDRTEHRIHTLLQQMDAQSTPTGRLLYMADKTSALIMALFYDAEGTPPFLTIDDPSLMPRDKAEMSICENRVYQDGYFASEMWTIDFFKARELVKYDDSGWFTGLIVMMTLIVKGKWYGWREKDYEKDQ